MAGVALSIVLSLVLLPAGAGAEPPETAPLPSPAVAIPSGGFVPGEIIVRYRAAHPFGAARPDGPLHEPRHVAPALRAFDARHALRAAVPLREAGEGPEAVRAVGSARSRLWLLRFDPGLDAAGLARELGRLPGIERAEPNWVGSLLAADDSRPTEGRGQTAGRRVHVPSDPLYFRQAADFAVIGAEQAWTADQASTTAAITVAIIDSGVDPFHADLTGALDLAASYNVAAGSTAIFDDIGHGTRVAGLVGAVADNGEGIAGVAFGCRLLSFDVADPSGTITAAHVIEAIHRASAAGADVINLSLRFAARSELMREACEAAVAGGALLVAGAGNEAQGDVAAYPAAFDAVAGVGALADDGVSRAPSSNFNGVERLLVEIAAPGETLFATVPGSQYDGEFGSGTSYATALVSGAGALVMARNPGQSGAAVRAHLKATASDAIGDVFAPGAGAAAPRRLDLAAAVATAMAPVLSVEVVRVDDGTAVLAGNDADGALDAGETAHLVVRVGVTGADAFGVSASLTTTNPALTGLDGTPQAVGVVRVGQAVDVTFGPVSVDPDAPQQVVSFLLELAADGGVAAQLPFAIPIEDETTVSGVIDGSPSPFVFAAGQTYRVSGPSSALFLFGEIHVEPGAVIRVDPGVDIVVGAGCTFLAEGTSEAPILFTRAGGAAAPLPPTASRYGPRTEPVDLGAYDQVRYVSASTGSDTAGDGTQGAPWATPWHAMNQIQAAGAGTRQAVLVAAGEYGGTRIDLPDGVHLLGGFDPATWERDIAAHATILTSSPDGSIVRGLGEDNTVDGFRFHMATEGNPQQNALTLGESGSVASNCIFVGQAIDHLSGPGDSISINGADAVFRRNLVTNIDYRAPHPFFGISGPSAVLERNIFVNITGDLIRSNGGFQQLEVLGNAFVGNRPMNDMLVLGTGSVQQSLRIRHNLFANQRRLTGGAWIINSIGEWAEVEMDGNVFARNTAAALNTGGLTSFARMTNNVLTRSFSTGGPEFVAQGEWHFANNTFFNEATEFLFRDQGEVMNSIFWYSGASRSDFLGTFSNVHDCIVRGGHAPGTDIIDADPQIEGIIAGGWARVLSFDPVSVTTTLDLGLSSEAPVRFPEMDELVFLGQEAALVAGRDGPLVRVWGDPFRYATTRPSTVAWFLESYRPRRSSPARGAGVGPALDPDVPLTDLEGNPRSGTTCDIGALQYREGGDGSWGRLWITPEASFASLRHVVVERGDGLLIDNAIVAVSDAVVRQNRLYGLRASVRPDVDGGTFARISARGNFGPGIDAGLVDLVDAIAEDNLGFGIRGANVQGARATRNSGVGITADFVADATAEANTGDGIVLLDQEFNTLGGTRLLARENGGRGILSFRSDVEDSRAERNGGNGLTIMNGGTLRTSFAIQNGGHGIVDDFAFVEDCVSERNAGTGVLGIGGRPLARSRVLDNGGPAVEDVALVNDSVIGGNGAGVLDGQTISGSLIFANAGVGVRGGSVTSSVVLGNAGDGIVNADLIDNSWVVDNGGRGLVGPSAGSGDLTATTVWRNAGVGVRNLLSAGNSNVFGNDAAAAAPIQASSSLAGSTPLDFEDNWWGEENTALLEGAAPNAPMPFLQDALDGSGQRLIDVWPYATTRLPVPDAFPPAFVLDALVFSEGSAVPLAPIEQLGVGLATFELLFSEAMDTTVAPSVTFGLGTTDAGPHAEKVVEAAPSQLVGAAPGWIDAATWRGTFAVESDTGDGVNRIRVSGAVAADDFALPDDVRLKFAIAGDAGLIANVGGADGSGEGGVRVFWDSRRLLAESGRGTLEPGFNVLRRRTAGGAEGPEVAFRKINSALVPLTPVEPPALYQEFFDASSEPGASYQYRVYFVDAGGNARQWTPTLSVTQAGPFVRSSGVLSR